MAIIQCNVVQGSGTCYSIPSVVFNENEPFTIYAIPTAGESLDDLQVFDQHGYAIAITPATEVYLNYNTYWGDVTVNAYFTGETPPEPPQPTFLDQYLWLICKAANNWRMRL